MNAVKSWWSGLSAEDQHAVKQSAQGHPLPAHLVVSLGNAGIPSVGTQWVGHQEGYDFQLPREVREFLDNQD